MSKMKNLSEEVRRICESCSTYPLLKHCKDCKITFKTEDGDNVIINGMSKKIESVNDKEVNGMN